MQEYFGNHKLFLFFLSLGITFLFLFFAIPSFVDSGDLVVLRERLSQYSSSFQPSISTEKKDPVLPPAIIEEDILPSESNSNSNSNNSISKEDPKPSQTDPNFSSESSLKDENVLFTHSIQFHSNGANQDASFSLSCSSFKKDCSIVLPHISSNREFLGWSSNANSTTPNYSAGDSITISSNQTLYAISRKTFSATILGNGAFSDTQILTCSSYNRDFSCSLSLPSIPKDFYTRVGYGLQDSKIDYENASFIPLSHDITLYPIRMVDTSSYDPFRNVALQVFEKMNSLRIQNGFSSLHWNQSLEYSAMLRVSEVMQNYDYNVSGDYHYRISNGKPFYSVNSLAYGENFDSIKELNASFFHERFSNSKAHYDNMMFSDFQTVGIAIGYDGEWYYIVELFGM